MDIEGERPIRRIRTFGYARVSTGEQNLDLQVDALEKAGCERIYQDRASGAKASRPDLDRLLAALQDGDTLITWKLDRLSRSAVDGIQLLVKLSGEGIIVKTLTGTPVDTSTAFGKAMTHMGLVWAELERDTIRERTYAGLAAARARGRRGGRKPKMDATRRKVAKDMFASREHTVAAIAKTLGVSQATVYRHLERS